MRALAIAMSISIATAACGPGAAVKTVSMRMVGSPSNASVTVDDQFVGTLEVVSTRGVALPPGTHHVSVEAAGFLPWDRVVEAHEGDGPMKLEVRLTPVPD